MARTAIPKEYRQALKNARLLIEQVMRMDGNEAETRRRVERIFETVLGYDALKHLSREKAVKGAAETEHVDFAIILEKDSSDRPSILVELKRVGIDLALKHLKQVTSYAVNLGCEWVILTNGRQWSLYHIEFGQPPDYKEIERWDLLTDEIEEIVQKFELISYRFVKNGGLDDLWTKLNVLKGANVLSAMLSPESLRLMCKIVRRQTSVLVKPEDMLLSIRKLLNESASTDLSNLKITLPTRGKSVKKPRCANKPAECKEPQSDSFTNPPEQSIQATDDAVDAADEKTE